MLGASSPADLERIDDDQGDGRRTGCALHYNERLGTSISEEKV